MNVLDRFVRWCPGALGFILRRKYYPRILGHCGKKVIFGRFLNFEPPESISVGNGVILSNHVSIRISGESKKDLQAILEDNVFVGAFSDIRIAEAGEIILRKGSNLSSCCTLHGHTPLEIGEDTLIAAYCEIGLPPDDLYQKSNTSITRIAQGCWLGCRVQQYAGTAIGKDSVVGAHALVAADIPSSSIAIGRPAKVHSSR